MTAVPKTSLRFSTRLMVGALALSAGLGLAQVAGAQQTAFRQAVAETAAGDRVVAAFHREQSYEAFWTAELDAARLRRAAVITVLRETALHGLPDGSARADALLAQMGDVRSQADLGAMEVALTAALIDLAHQLSRGVVVPSSVDDGMVREVPAFDKEAFLVRFAQGDPLAVLRGLAPDTREYRGLMKAKLGLEALIREGGWGATVTATKLEPGASGAQVVALRDRLVRMGYLAATASGQFDGALQAAVQRFQLEHGLEPDGVAGKGTLEEINTSPEERLKSVLVAMERERWLHIERTGRYILVNQTDFTAKIIDDGAVTFRTRSVIGMNQSDRRSPEFSDVMEHMVINPSWYVPRSIIANEYLPKLRSNPNAVSHLEITDSRGRRVNRGAVDFSQYSSKSFPFAMRQPPGDSNALGLVKFMFPNRHNIYLHDTPQKHLFARESRAYSHGCIRLADPFDFAYALLARQTEDPKAFFQSILKTGKETRVELEQHVPVHLIYRTAFMGEGGGLEFRRDVYGRDKKIWAALDRAGVALTAYQG